MVHVRVFVCQGPTSLKAASKASDLVQPCAAASLDLCLATLLADASLLSCPGSCSILGAHACCVNHAGRGGMLFWLRVKVLLNMRHYSARGRKRKVGWRVEELEA